MINNQPTTSGAVSVESYLPQSVFVGGLDTVRGHRYGRRRRRTVAIGQLLMVDSSARRHNTQK